MEKKSINKDTIISLIKEEAEVIRRKKEIFNQVIELNNEVKELNENRGIAGTFGFKSDMEDGSVTGFKETPNISYLAQLEKEFGMDKEAETENPINEEELNEISALKAENESLKERLRKIEETLNSPAE